MCTAKKLLFSTRSYRLRRWLEETFKTSIYKATTSNSYYYNVDYAPDCNFKIRISDHFPTEHKTSADYNVIITFDPHDINRNAYIIMLKGFENNVITINDFRELKYDITHAIIYSKMYSEMYQSNQRQSEIRQQESEDNSQLTATQRREVKKTKSKKNAARIVPSANVVSTSLKHAEEFIEFKNKSNRTDAKYWSGLSGLIPGWLSYDKNVKRALTNLFQTPVDFDEACQWIEENSNLSKPNFIVEIYKKTNSLKKALK